MPWVVTLQINDCSTNHFLPYATINDGYNLYSADGNGQFIAIVDDGYTAYIIQISKSGYISRNFTLSQNQNGTTQNVCLNPQPAGTGGGGGTSGGISCFIVSAATGSAQSDEVERLRALRDRVAGASRLASSLIDAIYDEYFRFSPAIAQRIEDDDVARQAVLWVVVKPLVAWYTLAGRLAFERDDANAIDEATKALASACPRFLGPSSIASTIDALRTGRDLPNNVPAQLGEFAARIRDAASHPRASWAILDALARAWSASAKRLDAVEQVAQWLADAPLHTLPVPDDCALDRDLADVAALLAFSADARGAVGRRLAQAWPHGMQALSRAGLVGDAAP